MERIPEGTKLRLKTAKKARSKRKRMPGEKSSRMKPKPTRMQGRVNQTPPMSWTELQIMPKFRRQWNDWDEDVTQA